MQNVGLQLFFRTLLFFLFVWVNHANGSSNSFKVCPWFSMLKWQNLSEWGCAVWGVYAAAGMELVNEPVRVIMFACFWFSLQIWPHICVRAHGLMCFVDSTAQKHVREEEGSIFSSLSLPRSFSSHTNWQICSKSAWCDHVDMHQEGFRHLVKSMSWRICSGVHWVCIENYMHSKSACHKCSLLDT